MQVQTTAIQLLGRLHEIAKEKEAKKAAVAEILKQADGLKGELKELEEEEAQIRKALEEEALKTSGRKLSYPGLGSVSVTQKEVWEITDMEEARAIVQENPAFFSAQRIEVNPEEFIRVALEIFERTGDLVTCLQKVTKTSTRVTLAKLEEEAKKASA